MRRIRLLGTDAWLTNGGSFMNQRYSPLQQINRGAAIGDGYDGLVIVGFAGGEAGIRGRIKAFDAHTGKLVWTFYTIPGPGEFWYSSVGRMAATPHWILPTATSCGNSRPTPASPLRAAASNARASSTWPCCPPAT